MERVPVLRILKCFSLRLNEIPPYFDEDDSHSPGAILIRYLDVDDSHSPGAILIRYLDVGDSHSPGAILTRYFDVI